jgi:hypothetical protein
MKYLTISLTLFFSSCTLIPWQSEIIDLGGNANFALIWVSYNVRYVDDGTFDRWQRPSETYRTKQGDCEDFAMLAASGLIAAGESDIQIVCYIPESWEPHAIIRWRGKYIEPQTGFEISLPHCMIIYDANFETTLQRCS